MFSSDKLNEISNKIKGAVQDSPLGDAEKKHSCTIKERFHQNGAGHARRI